MLQPLKTYHKMEKIIFASTNTNKIADISRIFTTYGIEVIAAPAAGAPEVEEYANTYIGNAFLKAKAYSAWLNAPCLADDSGIEFTALNNEPGVISARFLPHLKNCEERNSEILKILETAHDRSCRMVSVLCFCINPDQYFISEGELQGFVSSEPRGEKGWGYEPIFQVKGTPYTMAEIRDSACAHSILDNHRTRAAHKIVKMIGKANNLS